MSNKRLKTPGTYQEPGRDSKSRLFRYRWPGGNSWKDHDFYPTRCREALTDLGVPAPGQTPLKRGAS